MTDDPVDYQVKMNCDVRIVSSVASRGYEQLIEMEVSRYGQRDMVFDIHHPISRDDMADYIWTCRSMDKMNVHQVSILATVLVGGGSVAEDVMKRLSGMEMVEE